MFGGGFGVGVTAVAARPFPAEALPPGVSDPAGPLPPGMRERPARLGELMPVARRSDAELAAELQRIARAEAQLAAWKSEVVMGLAIRRPAGADPAPGQPGAASPRWLSCWDWESVA